VQVPRDREGQFHTQVFERYRRDVPQVAQGLTEMFVAGVSTHKVGRVAETLMGVAPSASAISRLDQDLQEQFQARRERLLQAHWRILYLDGIHFSVRHADQADATIILRALGVDLAGTKEVLALRACAEEDKDDWVSLLQDLRARGAIQMDLIVTDGRDGLLAAVRELFPATPRQRSLLRPISWSLLPQHSRFLSRLFLTHNPLQSAECTCTSSSHGYRSLLNASMLTLRLCNLRPYL
jgi:putative transposase